MRLVLLLFAVFLLEPACAPGEPSVSSPASSPQTQPAATLPASSQPPEGGTPVNGLRVSLAAQRDVFFIYVDSWLKLTATFSNVGDKPLKLSVWMLRYVPTLTGPDGQVLTPKKERNKADFFRPKVQTLAPGQSISLPIREFPRLKQWNDELHFDLSKPGPYRLRLTYTSKMDSTLSPDDKDCWQGTVASNEIVIDAVGDKGPPVKGLQLSLAADRNIYVLGTSEDLRLTVTFTNVSDKPLKLTHWMLYYEPTMTGPDGPMMPGIDNGPDTIEPKETDVQTLAAGQSVAFTISGFPTFVQAWRTQHFDLPKPGRYRLRLTYASVMRPDFPGTFKDCWQGTLTSNEITIDVQDRSGK